MSKIKNKIKTKPTPALLQNAKFSAKTATKKPAAKATKTYWAIKRDGKVIFDGTFKECWSSLTARFGAKTLKEIRASNIEIARIA